MKSNYFKSKQILTIIKSAKKVLLNCHINPDLDSVGSATAFYEMLTMMGKKPEIVCPNIIPEKMLFLPYAKKIKTIDFSDFDFTPYDLFINLDSASDDRVTSSKKIYLPKDIKMIVIDHHKTNVYKNFPILINHQASSTCEIIYNLFQDWKVNINKNIASSILAGIVGDTVFFKRTGNPKKVFAITTDLLEKGADFQSLVNQVYSSYDFLEIKLLGEYLKRMKFDIKKRFVWSAVPYEVFAQYGSPSAIREIVADMFFQSINGADFGMVILEDKPGQIRISLRSKGGFDVSKIALSLGGGGHKNAAGATLKGDYSQCLKKILATI